MTLITCHRAAKVGVKKPQTKLETRNVLNGIAFRAGVLGVVGFAHFTMLLLIFRGHLETFIVLGTYLFRQTNKSGQGRCQPLDVSEVKFG